VGERVFDSDAFTQALPTGATLLELSELALQGLVLGDG
jgi:hypothetical protein